MTSVSAGHIILTPTQPVGSGLPQRESNPGPPHQESRALPSELPPLPAFAVKNELLQCFVGLLDDSKDIIGCQEGQCLHLDYPLVQDMLLVSVQA